MHARTLVRYFTYLRWELVDRRQELDCKLTVYYWPSGQKLQLPKARVFSGRRFGLINRASFVSVLHFPFYCLIDC